MTILADISFLENLRNSALLFIALVVSITLHEFGHAWMANRRGDPLPRLQGRVTLDPRAHMDKFGTLILPALMIFVPALFGSATMFVFGWGKPVQISLPSRDPKKRKWDDILITLAGPGVNIILALLAAIAIGIAIGSGSGEQVIQFFALFMSLNLVLAIFNLIPMPPLDGSHLLFYAVKMRRETFDRLTKNSWWIFLLLILLPSPSNSVFSMVMRPIIGALWIPFSHLAGLIAQIVAMLSGSQG